MKSLIVILLFTVLVAITTTSGHRQNLVISYCNKFNAYPNKFRASRTNNWDDVVTDDTGSQLIDMYISENGQEDDLYQWDVTTKCYEWRRANNDEDFKKSNKIFGQIMDAVTDEDDETKCKEALGLDDKQCAKFKRNNKNKADRVEKLMNALEENLSTNYFETFMNKVNADLSQTDECP